EIWVYGVFPVKLKWLAIFEILIVYFMYARGFGQICALFTLVAPAAGFVYVRKLPRLNLSLPTRPASRKIPPLLKPDVTPRERLHPPTPRHARDEEAEIIRLRRLLGDDDEGRGATRH